jgi:hypothetical protein
MLQMKQECRSALKYIIDLHSKQRMTLYHRQYVAREALFKSASSAIEEAMDSSRYNSDFNLVQRTALAFHIGAGSMLCFTM